MARVISKPSTLSSPYRCTCWAHGHCSTRKYLISITLQLRYVHSTNVTSIHSPNNFVSIQQCHSFPSFWQARYDKQWLDVEWSQNNTILIPNAIEVTTPPNIALDNYNGMNFDASRIGLEYDLSGSNGAATNEFDLTSNTEQLRRRRRSTSRLGRLYNPYLQQLIDDHNDYSEAPHRRTRRGLFDSHEHILNNLPPNRTIHFDCVNAEEGACVQAKFTVYNFKPSNVPVLVSFNFSIDLNVIGEFFGVADSMWKCN